MLEKDRGRGAGQSPEAILGAGELGGRGAGLLGLLMTPEWNKKEGTQETGLTSYHLCCLFTFYFDFFAFPLSLDNETRLVSFIPVSIKISFPSWFSDTCCCVLVQRPQGVLESRHTPPLRFSGIQSQKKQCH